MIITTLIENTPAGPKSTLSAEHGLSLHIAFDKKMILFDTGASDAFLRNADVLGIDLSTVDAAILSHHHYDHGGGLRQFFSLNQHAKVYLKRPPDGEPYFKARLLPKRYIGLERDLLTAYARRFVFIDQATEILPNVYLITDIGTSYPKPKGNKYLHIKTRTGWSPDTFSHELMMVIGEHDGLVIFTGCAHNGVLNMIDSVEKIFSGVPIKAVVGGFHLIGLPKTNMTADSQTDIRKIADKILNSPIRKIYTGHCTGMKAYDILKSLLGEKLEHLHTGTVLTT